MCSSHDSGTVQHINVLCMIAGGNRSNQKRQHHAVTETNCTVRMARKKNASTERSPRILERQGQNIRRWLNHEMGTVGYTYGLRTEMLKRIHMDQ